MSLYIHRLLTLETHTFFLKWHDSLPSSCCTCPPRHLAETLPLPTAYWAVAAGGKGGTVCPCAAGHRVPRLPPPRLALLPVHLARQLAVPGRHALQDWLHVRPSWYVVPLALKTAANGAKQTWPFWPKTTCRRGKWKAARLMMCNFASLLFNKQKTRFPN